MPSQADDRVTIHITWWKLLTLAAAIVAPVVVTVGGGYWLLIGRVIGAVQTSVSELRTDTGDRFASRERDTHDIRRLLQESDQKLGDELKGLGDRIVASNRDNGEKIEALRNSLVQAVTGGTIA